MRRPVGLMLLLAAFGIAAALLVARLPPDFERTVVTRYHHGSDPLLTAALLRFDTAALLRAPHLYYEPPYLHPDRNPMRGTEPLVSEALLAAPLRLLLGDRPALVYTASLYLTLALVVLATGLLLHELGVRTSLAVAGAVLSVTVATTAIFFDRLQAVSLQWHAFALYFAVRTWRRPRLVPALALAACVFLAVHASLYMDVMLLGVAPFVAPALCSWRRWLRERRRVAVLAAATALGLAVAAAVLWPYARDRADVAAYSSAVFAGQKVWGAASLGHFQTSAPEYGRSVLRIAPEPSWDGVYPGTAPLLLCALTAVLALAAFARDLVRHRLAPDARWPRLLVAAAAAAAITSSLVAAYWPRDPASRVPDVFLWLLLVLWSARLLLWPAEDRSLLPRLSSLFGLAALVLFLMSFGSPVRVHSGEDVLQEGIFGALSALLPPLREMRELRRCMVPGGWAAALAVTLALERHVRALPRLFAPTAATILLAIGLAERVDADTRKASLPPVPEPYGLLRRSQTRGALLELPFDPWGRITSVHRMLWQPSHGRAIVAGKTGLDPSWYAPAHAVFREFPSEESLALANAFGVTTIIERRTGSPDGESLPDGVELRGAAATEDVRWRVLDLGAAALRHRVPDEPARSAGEWTRPSAAASAHAAVDGLVDTAAEAPGGEGLELVVPRGATAIELDFGHGRHSRVPPELRVLGYVDGEWQDVTRPPANRWLRARVARMLLRERQARLMLPLRPSGAERLRLISEAGPWDLPEVRVCVGSGP